MSTESMLAIVKCFEKTNSESLVYSEVIVDERITDDNSVNGDNSSSFGVFMIKLTYANRDLAGSTSAGISELMILYGRSLMLTRMPNTLAGVNILG